MFEQRLYSSTQEKKEGKDMSMDMATVAREVNRYMRPVLEAAYIVYQEAGKVKAKNGMTGEIEISDSDASVVIQAAINNLASGRTWKEKISILGDLDISAAIQVPSYTVLDVSGKLTSTGNNNIIESASMTTSSIQCEINGGILDGDGNTTDGIYGIFSWGGIRNCTIQNCVNGINLTGYGALGGAGPTYLGQETRPCQLTIEDNFIAANAAGINLDAYCSDNLIAKNMIAYNTVDGIKITSASKNVITGNTIWSATETSKLLSMVGGLTGCLVSANHFDSNAGSGIVIEATGTSNIVNVQIHNNIITGIGWGTNNAYDAIQFINSGSGLVVNNSIQGNQIFTFESNKPRYGINVSGSTYNIILGNYIGSTGTAAMSAVDGNSINANNLS